MAVLRKFRQRYDPMTGNAHFSDMPHSDRAASSATTDWRSRSSGVGPG
jgi:hypothetical protein